MANGHRPGRDACSAGPSLGHRWPLQWHSMDILCIRAHPDDCDLSVDGAAAPVRGDRVGFLSVTNGDRGHIRVADPQ